ncbi:MAG: Trehalose transport system permease protein SugB [Alphaproteobacteria bacterium MarineAlpha5_Bin5]|nr:MAG: Trehalose transport system permease protein SugB [Alphaproteobacteria bacterium MarineAlpha5_Bin5]|tara:strand:+ start:925 stop:1752 length:828 start_codon:yes stop_codon:yes gene_type:complete
MNYQNREKIIAHSIFLLGSLIVLYPFISILFLALSEPGTRVSGFTIPSGIYFDNFIKAWTGGGFANGLLNSFIVVVGVVSIAILCSILAAYAFEKLDIFGVTPLFAILLIGLVLPYESIVISLYYSMKSYDLTNTHLSLILPQIGLSIPFSIFWLRASFRAIPKSLSEAAMIEGATRFTILTKILIPQMIPAILTLTVLLFMWTWNEFLLALIMIQDAEMRTAPLALSYFAGNKRYGDPAITAAAAIWVALPVLITYIFLQRKFISGMVTGAVKE